MVKRPDIKAGEWIVVDGSHCVVANVRDEGNTLGDCEVVLNASKPANRDARWNGGAWEFEPSGDYGGYADRYQRLAPYVRILKGLK